MCRLLIGSSIMMMSEISVDMILILFISMGVYLLVILLIYGESMVCRIVKISM